MIQTDVLTHRFEPDMLAFSGCYYGGGEKEKKELGEIRKRWKNLHVSFFFCSIRCKVLLAYLRNELHMHHACMKND